MTPAERKRTADDLDRRACVLLLFGQTVEAELLIAEATRLRKRTRWSA